jgi:hypothetical protein
MHMHLVAETSEKKNTKAEPALILLGLVRLDYPKQQRGVALRSWYCRTSTSRLLKKENRQGAKCAKNIFGIDLRRFQ